MSVSMSLPLATPLHDTVTPSLCKLQLLVVENEHHRIGSFDPYVVGATHDKSSTAKSGPYETSLLVE